MLQSIYNIFFLQALTKSDNTALRTEANSYCSLFLYLGVASGISIFLQIYGFGYAGEKLTYSLRNKLFVTMLNQEIGFYDRKENGVGALCAQLSGDAASVQGVSAFSRK